MRTNPARRLGFTLAELLVGLAVTSIVMTAVVAIFIGVQRSYQAETEVKIITENGRGAMLFLERVLPLAGYGVDPRVAFDLTNQVARDNENVVGVSYTPAQTALTGSEVRSDELAFRFRDPAFLHAGRINGSTLTLDTPLTVALPKEKLLMVGCRGGVDYTMVRVNALTAAGGSTVNVHNALAGAPFSPSSANCLSATGSASPWVFMVQEHRLRIVNLGGRPWLVSFRNLEASVTDLSLDNFDPIAPDVETFQVAFGMNRARPSLTCCTAAPDTGGNYVVGDTVGEAFFSPPTGVLGSLPDYRTSYDAPQRFTAHPANIRSVHVALVLRSSRTQPTGRQEFRSGNIFNNPAPAAVLDGYKRSFFHSAISTPNLLSRSGFGPAIRTSALANDLNSWGG